MTNSQILLKECVAQEYEETSSFDSEATFFEFFSASQVLKDYDLSDEELENGLVGAGNDGGCDAIYLFLNRNLVLSDQLDTINIVKESNVEFIIVQAKRETSFGENAIMKWKTISDNLLPLSNTLENFKTRYNEDVIIAFEAFRDLHTKLLRNRVKLTFKFYYVTYAADLHPNVIQQAEELKAIVKNNYPNAKTDVFLLMQTGYLNYIIMLLNQ